MSSHEKATRARDAALEDLKSAIDSNLVRISRLLGVKIVRLTRITDSFIQSNLGLEYYMIDVPDRDYGKYFNEQYVAKDSLEGA